mmetsp:Transcript_32771/g.77663  ORF Transcript_32771/g.77663 Transcript_32771/m.77663 type:complete len:215 (+) Transcript_32771:642-1286(+)
MHACFLGFRGQEVGIAREEFDVLRVILAFFRLGRVHHRDAGPESCAEQPRQQLGRGAALLVDRYAHAVGAILAAASRLDPARAHPGRHDPSMRERLEELALELSDLLEGLDAEESLARERETLLLPERVELVVGVEHGEVVALQEREPFLGPISLLAPLHGHQERRARRQRGSHGESFVGRAEAHSVEDQLPEVNVDREADEELSQRSELLGVG